jgi:ArsR family transcriptional regulator
MASARAATKPGNSVDLMFRALSDRTRLRILHLLRDGELCVCDLTRVIDAPQPKISRHLAYLRQAKLVAARKDGLWSYYSLAPARGVFHEKLLDCLSHCFADVPELAKDRKKLRTACDDGCCD